MFTGEESGFRKLLSPWPRPHGERVAELVLVPRSQTVLARGEGIPDPGMIAYLLEKDCGFFGESMVFC